jgi:hypothetical protein
MNIMNWLIFLMAMWNGMASVGCQYDYKTFTWTCPPAASSPQRSEAVVGYRVPGREDKREGSYPTR